MSKLFTLGLATPAVKAFDRHQEEVADAEGQKILERAVRPRWAVAYWLTRARAAYGDTGGHTHPKTSDRIARLDPVPADAAAICSVAPTDAGGRSGAGE